MLPHVEHASKYVSECNLVLPVRPPRDLSADGINSWITSLIETSETDSTRPANIVDGINNFRADAVVGALVSSISQINGGRRFFPNPATMYAGFKASLDPKISAVHAPLPPGVRDLAVKIFSSDIVDQLNAKRYTAAIMNFNNEMVWADAPTLATKYRSQFDRQFVRDTVYDAISLARIAAEPYIGKPRQQMYIINMRKDIIKGLSSMVPDRLTNFVVSIVDVPGGNITGRTKVRLLLETSKETRRIEFDTYIQLGGGAANAA